MALDYQAAHPDVLVVTTADHETAGLALGHGTEYFTTIGNLSDVTCSQESLSGLISDDPDNAVALAEGCGLVLTDEYVAMLGEYPPEAGRSKASISATPTRGRTTSSHWQRPRWRASSSAPGRIPACR